MPTGTGKTGVIATIALAIESHKPCLVLTPWANLAHQMIQHLRKDFWDTIGWKPARNPSIERLLPSTAARLLGAGEGGEVTGRGKFTDVYVGTFATLVSLFNDYRDRYELLREKISMVIVDEGHYEPAPTWGLAVRFLRRPIVLLTATPYRNDLKLFRILAADIFHLTHDEAVKRHIIRDVRFEALSDVPLDPDTFVSKFSRRWRNKRTLQLPSKSPRTIICCATRDQVQRIATALVNRGVNAIGVHERFNRSSKTFLFNKVPKPENTQADVWVHQHKLTEGLDDARFAMVVLFAPIRNDRKLIQQIGRILRKRPGDKTKAVVLTPEAFKVQEAWSRYLEFEKDTESFVPERFLKILNAILDVQPPMEYFGRKFRSRFDPHSPNVHEAVLLPPSTIARRILSSFRLEEFIEFTTDFLQLEDRVLLGPNRDRPIKVSDKIYVWVYAIFGNSPILKESSQYEIRLGATALVLHAKHLFMVDTESSYPQEYLTKHCQKLTPNQLGRLLGGRIVAKEVSLRNIAPTVGVVRRSVLFSDNLDSTPAQITDSLLLCTAARARMPSGIRRYVGFLRGRVSDDLTSIEGEEFTFQQYVRWTARLAKTIEDPRQSIADFFHRYLKSVDPPTFPVPAFAMVDLSDYRIHLEDSDRNELEIVDSVVEVMESPKGREGQPRFQFKLSFRETRNENRKIECTFRLAYSPNMFQYHVESDSANARVFVVEEAPGVEPEGIATHLNHNDDLLTLILEGGLIVYASGAFYEIDYSYAEEGISSSTKAYPRLANVSSEKGKPPKGATAWPLKTVFGLIDNRRDGLIWAEFGRADLVICDDIGDEIADFIAINFKDRCIALIHAKAGKSRFSASALHVVVSQALKNLSVLAKRQDPPVRVKNWTRSAIWGCKIKRWRYGNTSLPTGTRLWEKIRREIIDHPQSRIEVWLVLGNILQKRTLLQKLQAGTRDNVTGQFVYLLSSLRLTCAQHGAVARIFCN
jgi:hypothetical protein